MIYVNKQPCGANKTICSALYDDHVFPDSCSETAPLFINLGNTFRPEVMVYPINSYQFERLAHESCGNDFKGIIP